MTPYQVSMALCGYNLEVEDESIYFANDDEARLYGFRP